MALTRTSTSAAVTANQVTNLGITSTSSGFPAAGTLNSRQIIQIDGEKMLLDQVVASGTINVLQRGYDGTVAVAHDILAPVVTSANPQDFTGDPAGAASSRPPYVDDVVAVGQNGTIAVPTKNTTVILTKGSALATTTLGAPAKDQDGLRLTITSQTAFAHVITATTLLENGASGSPFTTATFAAFIGAGFHLIADNGVWNVVGTNGVTLS